MKRLLIATRNPAVWTELQEVLQARGLLALEAKDLGSAASALKKGGFDGVILDLELAGPRRSIPFFRQVLAPFQGASPRPGIIVICQTRAAREAVWALKAGADDVITLPFEPGAIQEVLDNITPASLKDFELHYLRERELADDEFEVKNTRNPAMKRLLEDCMSVSPTMATVLLEGETGTGKGILARRIHKNSPRKNAPFISVHCGAIPDTLLESELFGHEKGAFTGAVKRKPGKFEIARGGTLFLDEIGTITPAAQIKLLQVLQDGIFQRVGGESTIHADVRIIAATNSDLKKLSDGGGFRADLFYRINVFPLKIPPLRQRPEDIAAHVDIFLKKLNRYNAKNIRALDPQVMTALETYLWPGNIRELENLLERAYILETTRVLRPESFPGELFDRSILSPGGTDSRATTLETARRKGIEAAEKAYLTALLKQHAGRIGPSASSAGISTRQLSNLLKKYSIHKNDFKRPPLAHPGAEHKSGK